VDHKGDVAAAAVSAERPAVHPTVLDAVRDLRRDVDATTFPLSIEGSERAEGSRLTLRRQLDDHVIPRLTELSAPAIVVVAGSTGAGKSTLVNSLLRTEVSTAGVLRPTTRRPVLAHHPADADLLREHRLHGVVTMVSHEKVPRGLALLDAPDLDSVLDTNREMADRLLEAADLWLFVTTAARYGDALPWRVLERAAARKASVAMVLNRVSTESVMEIRMDLMTRLREHGMTNVPLFVVPDQGPHEGLLEERGVAPINRWLGLLAGRDRARAVILRTLRGALRAVLPWVDELADHVDAQVDARAALEDALGAALAPPADAAAAAMAHGTVVDGTVRARWSQLSAPGGQLDNLFTGSGRARWSQLSAPGGQLDNLFTGSGRARRSGRRGRARSEALLPLIDDLQASVASSLTAAGGYAESAVHAVMTGPTAPGGGESVFAAVDLERLDSSRGAVAEQAAHDWVATGRQSVEALRAVSDPTGRSMTAGAVRAVGGDGLTAIALAAAAGFEPAAELLERLLGEDAGRLRQHLTSDLAAAARAQVRREGGQLGAFLRIPALAPDAAATLRLRLAVLKDLT